MKPRLGSLILITMLSAGISRAEDPTPIPELKLWEKNMVVYGDKFKDQRALGIFPETHIYYYDGEWVYFQIADYTKDPKWLVHSQNCRETYRNHVLELNGKLPGHRVHPHGLYEDFIRNKDMKSREALLLLAKNSHFAPNNNGGGGAPSYLCCRENGYILMTLVLAEAIGEPQPKLAHSVKAGCAALDQHSTSKDIAWIQPFFSGIQAEGLILYADRHNAADKVLPSLVRYADWLWDHCWIAKEQGFCYRRENPNDPKSILKGGCPGLNLLIAPMYAWLYKKTGEPRFRDRGDLLFAGGVKNAWLDGGKQFSQNYRWSFSYVKWRREGPERGASKSTGSEFTPGLSKKKPAVKEPEIASASDTIATPEPKAPVVKSAPAAPAVIDTAKHRATVEADLKINAKVRTGDKVTIQSLKEDTALASINEKGVGILVQGNEMPMRWKDLTDEDIVRLAALYCHDAEPMYSAGVLATATRQTKVREKFLDQLSELDPQRAIDLDKMR
jgi:hypothetical protein